MGRGSYTASDWNKLRNSRKLYNHQPVNDIFNQQQGKTIYNSKNIQCRESCDPDIFMQATPIIIGFDVTASMGYLAKELATSGLNNIITALLTHRQITAPQIMCAAIGDCKSDNYPLQLTQFESDIKIIAQLLDLHLENGGGGNNGESYNLLWYFAAHHTEHDHYKKRQKKGYLFTIGNDRCHSGLLAQEISSNFKAFSAYTISNEALINKASEKYNIFHIHIENGTASDDDIFADWQKLLPGNCTSINIKNIDCLAELITTIISISEGLTPGNALQLINQEKAERLARSVAFIKPAAKSNVISF